MTRFTAMLTMLALIGSASAEAQTAEAQRMVITRAGSRAVRPGPATNFTGEVRVEMLFEALAPSHASGGSATFQPGARTAWHFHPAGQILIVTAGTGRVQGWGGGLAQAGTTATAARRARLARCRGGLRTTTARRCRPAPCR